MTKHVWLYFLTIFIVLFDVGFFSELNLFGKGFIICVWLVSLLPFTKVEYFFRLVILTSLLTELFGPYPLGWNALSFAFLYAFCTLARGSIIKHPKIEMVFFLFVLSGLRLVSLASSPLSILSLQKILVTTITSFPLYLILRWLLASIFKKFFGPSYLQLKLYQGGEARV
ncbi:MAG: hypothetical protein Q8N84_03485 [bacterium]|nr:hypothetical protein [bacterium]